MTAKSPAPFFDGSFPHHWQAEVLAARPIILPARHHVYPAQAEEVERGALEVLIRPLQTGQRANNSGIGSNPEIHSDLCQGTTSVVPQPRQEDNRALAPEGNQADAQPFLATCALGFGDPAVPTGLWSTPSPNELCAVSGGYAYIIDTTAPEHFTMISFRPVLEIFPAVEQGLLLFVGHHSILAWGRDGEAWQSEKLSAEGVTISGIEGGILHGLGWNLFTDKETPFALDLRTGLLLTAGPEPGK